MVGFDTEPDYGIAYDHPAVWGLTDKDGYLTWNTFGIPNGVRGMDRQSEGRSGYPLRPGVRVLRYGDWELAAD